MNIPLLILLIFGFTLLSGCASQNTSAFNQSAQINKMLDEHSQRYKSCNEKTSSSAESEYVSTKILIKSDTAPNRYELLSSKDKVTEKSKSMLLRFLETKQQCRDLALRELKIIHNPFAQLVGSLFMKADSEYGKYLAGDITVGTLNQNINNIENNFEREWVLEARRLTDIFSSQHQAEISNRHNQLMSLQSLTPKTTSCQAIGSIINCTSF